MGNIVALKFDQNDSIWDKLLGTKGLLFEATRDLEFGCGPNVFRYHPYYLFCP